MPLTRSIFQPRKTIPLLLGLFLSLLVCAMATSPTVNCVYDGDTIGVKSQGVRTKVRLVGIDAPELCETKRELEQPYSREAKDHLTRRLLGKTVELRGYGYKRHGLFLGEVFLDGESINLEMIEEGLAEVYRGKTPVGFSIGSYHEAENSARDAERGIWSLGDDYRSPREWRKSARLRAACALVLFGICSKKEE